MRVCPHCRTEYGPDQKICPNDGARLDDGPGAVDALIGQVLAERYRIIKTLGEGGMGRVYLAEHTRMGRMSAIKVMSPSLAPTADAIGRFNREAANASRINHPNVAAIYDFGETADGTLYLAMEYVEGETLSQVLARTGPLTISRVGDLTRQIGNALHAAHQLGIVHRDLKPDNILLTRDADGVERVKVVDFGIAKNAGTRGQTVTTAGVSVGTPEYMSPEQLAGSDIDFRTDIYSLGLVVFAMLTNELPYPPLSSKESLIQRLTEPPRPLAEVVPLGSWPAPLQSALNRAMSPEAKDRYPRVEEFALDVASAAGAKAVSSEPRTRRMTPIHTSAPAPGSTQPIRRGNAVARIPIRKRRSTKIGVSAIVAAVVLALGIRRYATSGNEPEKKVATADSTRPAATDTLERTDAALPVATVPVEKPIDTPRVALKSAPIAKPRVVQSDTAKSSRTTAAAGASTIAPTKPDSMSGATIANMMNRVGKRAGQHGWLRTNGDSVDFVAPTASLIAAETREIMGHINRAQKAFAANQLMRGLPDIRTAYEEYMIFAADHPDARETAIIGKQFRTLTASGIATCNAMRDSAVAKGQQGPPCEMLRAAMTANMPQGAARPPLRPDRRQLRPKP